MLPALHAAAKHGRSGSDGASQHRTRIAPATLLLRNPTPALRPLGRRVLHMPAWTAAQRPQSWPTPSALGGSISPSCRRLSLRPRAAGTRGDSMKPRPPPATPCPTLCLSADGREIPRACRTLRHPGHISLLSVASWLSSLPPSHRPSPPSRSPRAVAAAAAAMKVKVHELRTKTKAPASPLAARLLAHRFAACAAPAPPRCTALSHRRPSAPVPPPSRRT